MQDEATWRIYAYDAHYGAILHAPGRDGIERQYMPYEIERQPARRHARGAKPHTRLFARRSARRRGRARRALVPAAA